MALAELQWGMAMADQSLIGFIGVKGIQGRPGSEAGRSIDIKLCLPTERPLIYFSGVVTRHRYIKLRFYCTAFCIAIAMPTSITRPCM
jgi:hypothetical protein